MELREPWRGHLARGDQWVTAQNLRFVRAWHRDGAFARRFALVLSPPTAEFAGALARTRWAPYGQPLLIHAAARLLGREPDTAFLHGVNLALHGLLVAALAGVAYALARREWRFSPLAAALLAFHCGAFCTFLPALLYWGQNLSIGAFTMLPCFVLCAWGRYTREHLAGTRRRHLLDVAVAASVFFASFADFFFWMLAPYWVIEGLAAAFFGRGARGRRGALAWAWIVGIPFAGAVATSAAIAGWNGQLAQLTDRFAYWTLRSAGAAGGVSGLALFALVRLASGVQFFATHFADAFALPGAVALGLVGVGLLRATGSTALSHEARRLFRDLLLPCLLFLVVLGPHQSFHTFAAMKYVPVVALGWAVGVPGALRRARRGRRGIAAAYGAVAFLVLFPETSGYQRFFAEPEISWDREAAFLRQQTRPDDVLFSPSTEIGLFPPQRIALAERRIVRAYGPLDLYFEIVRAHPALRTAARPDLRIGIFRTGGPRARLGPPPTETLESGNLSLDRFHWSALRAFLAERPCGVYLRHADELRADSGPPAGAPRPLPGPVARLPRPLSLYVATASPGPDGLEWLQWWDERHFHWHSAADEFVAVGPDRFRRPLVWDVPLPFAEVDEVPAEPGAWVAFVEALFREPAPPGGPPAFAWRGYTVVPRELRDVPAVLRQRSPAARVWRAWEVLDVRSGIARPVAVALAPTTPGADAVSIVLDEPAAALEIPEVEPAWRVEKSPRDGVRP